MKQIDMETVGRIVRFHRKRSGLSRLALADLAGIGKTAIFDIEKGKPTLRMDTLLAVLGVLNITLEMRSPLMGEWQHMQERAEHNAEEASS